MTFNGRLFAEKREAKRYSQRELAEEAGVKSSFVADIEAGNSKKPNYPDLVRVCRVLGADPDLFFDDVAGNFKQSIQSA